MPSVPSPIPGFPDVPIGPGVPGITPDPGDLPVHGIAPDVPVTSKVDPSKANKAKAKGGGIPWWGWLAIGFFVLKKKGR